MSKTYLEIDVDGVKVRVRGIGGGMFRLELDDFEDVIQIDMTPDMLRNLSENLRRAADEAYQDLGKDRESSVS